MLKLVYFNLNTMKKSPKKGTLNEIRLQHTHNNKLLSGIENDHCKTTIFNLL